MLQMAGRPLRQTPPTCHVIPPCPLRSSSSVAAVSSLCSFLESVPMSSRSRVASCCLCITCVPAAQLCLCMFECVDELARSDNDRDTQARLTRASELPHRTPRTRHSHPTTRSPIMSDHTPCPISTCCRTSVHSATLMCKAHAMTAQQLSCRELETLSVTHTPVALCVFGACQRMSTSRHARRSCELHDPSKVLACG
jgi:hypothetical protein